MTRHVRLGVAGRSGVGKSATRGFLVQELGARGFSVTTVRLAEPLYDLQALVYTIAGRPLPDRLRQDGELLGFLGAKLREINPTSLVDILTSRIHSIESAQTAPTAIVCDDVRAPEAAALRSLGFTLILVHAPAATRDERLRQRQNLSTIGDDHVTESGVDEIEAAHVIENDGTLVELRAMVESICGSVVED